MFIIRHLKTGDILTPEKDDKSFSHNGYELMIGFDGKVYWVCAGDGGLYIDDVSDEYELIVK